MSIDKLDGPWKKLFQLALVLLPVSISLFGAMTVNRFAKDAAQDARLSVLESQMARLQIDLRADLQALTMDVQRIEDVLLNRQYHVPDPQRFNKTP